MLHHEPSACLVTCCTRHGDVAAPRISKVWEGQCRGDKDPHVEIVLSGLNPRWKGGAANFMHFLFRHPYPTDTLFTPCRHPRWPTKAHICWPPNGRRPLCCLLQHPEGVHFAFNFENRGLKEPLVIVSNFALTFSEICSGRNQTS